MIRHLLIAGALCLFAAAAAADEQAFLGSLEGKWTGRGIVKVRADGVPINVSCSFDTRSAGLAFSMRGTCRGLILISRSISADLNYNGAHYSGTYIGPKGGRSGLVGNRRGSAINLTIHWAKEVNGDRRATLVLQKVGENGMKLTTLDDDPRSGGRIVTSDINLRRM
jgi:hypothetical protein